jgi:hypothetical protein
MSTSKGFKSAAHRRAVFATNPSLAFAIADKYGAKVGGGFTKAQLRRRAAAAGKSQPYRDPRNPNPPRA